MILGFRGAGGEDWGGGLPNPTKQPQGLWGVGWSSWLPLVSCGKFLGILGVPAASLQRGNNRAEVTGSSSSRKKRLSVSVTSSTKCSPGRSFTERASRRNSARSRRLRARAPPFRYMPSSWSPENSQHLCLPLPKDPTTHPLSLTAPPPMLYGYWRKGAREEEVCLQSLDS